MEYIFSSEKNFIFKKKIKKIIRRNIFSLRIKFNIFKFLLL